MFSSTPRRSQRLLLVFALCFLSFALGVCSMRHAADRTASPAPIWPEPAATHAP